ncbi:unnamed protein product (macronuclear) [Paramecium tetraurelia]|uniref:Protein kinase domain-containing protein n=1 Tax=Paramecium tetraurelia TaxID=5888 RepID=A0CZR6_PARTE|nr:uncharacterized protein GSPATT00011856001 [Paramecium tetraurelia]CAK76283.1 unnamed protein product [Paramecium tetraurelia]|eukprot:XP_001443680.1 hypothetical protein (macronuclear) [Paramecium tetraurelia strain d4-2]
MIKIIIEKFNIAYVKRLSIMIYRTPIFTQTTINYRIKQQKYLNQTFEPQNILLGVDKENLKIFLIDLGISKIQRDSNRMYIQFKDQKSFLGKTRYALIPAHMGHKLGRKDDFRIFDECRFVFFEWIVTLAKYDCLQDEERAKKVGEMQLSMEHEIFKDYCIESQCIFEYHSNFQFKLHQKTRIKIRAKLQNDSLIIQKSR